MLSRFLKARRAAAGAPAPALPPGRRLYAIGDIHGRLDLLDTLLEIIGEDDRARGPAQTGLIVLGDLVDRGPDSAGVVERLRTLAAAYADVRLLTGNHEEVFLAALDGEERTMRFFCRIGGRETILSYGMTAEEYEGLDYAGVAAWLSAAVPPEHRAFLGGFEDWIAEGDYLFVHAGIRPGVPVDQQDVRDLRWIREEFLDHRGPLEAMVVHGHTITETADFRANRIGIDTGAYASGQLTALGLEGTAQWILQATDVPR